MSHAPLTVGSVFSGAGLLDLGLEQAGLRHAWFCERDPFRRRLLAARWPGVPVYDDIRALRGPAPADAGRVRGELRRGPRRVAGESERAQNPASQRERARDAAGDPGQAAARIDVLAGGFPCRGVSVAGKREGMGNAETVLWREMARLAGELRPRYVIVENVAAILALHGGAVWGEVVGDLAALGFDIEWDVLPAAAVGAPHRRERVFAVAAHPNRVRPERGGPAWDGRAGFADGDVGDAAAADADGARLERHRQPRERSREQPASARDTQPAREPVPVEWGTYEPAIRRWETVHGPAPTPLTRVRGVDDGGAPVRRVRAGMDRPRLSALGDGVQVQLGRLVGEYVRALDSGY